jgi:hypothetical protein
MVDEIGTGGTEQTYNGNRDGRKGERVADDAADAEPWTIIVAVDTFHLE